MPNWVKTNMFVSGSTEDLEKFEAAVKGEGSPFSFQAFYPMPVGMNVISGSTRIGNRGGEFDNGVWDYREIAQYRMEHLEWPDGFDPGKKLEPRFSGEKKLLWETVEDMVKQIIQNIEEYGASDWYEWSIQNWGTKWDACKATLSWPLDSTIFVQFDTAWSLATGALEKLASLFPSLRFDGQYADEDLGSNCGYFVASRGEFSITMFEGTGEGSFEFACSVWNYDPEELRREYDQDEESSLMEYGEAEGD